MTIREYLLLGVSPNLSVNEKIIKSALKTAMAIDFIEKFPDEENFVTIGSVTKAQFALNVSIGENAVT